MKLGKMGIAISVLTVIMAFSITGVSAADWTQTQLTSNTVDDLYPSIDNSGNIVVFVEDVDGNEITKWDKEILLIDVRTSSVERLTSNVVEEDLPSISGDGSKIVFQSMLDGDWEIFSMNPDGSGLRQLTYTLHGIDDLSPVINSDASSIVYQSFDPAVEESEEIFVMNTDGSGQRQLTDNDLVDYLPVIGSDTVVFVGRTGESRLEFSLNEREIYVSNTGGSRPVALTDNDVYDSEPSISDDGSRIAFISEEYVEGDRSMRLFVINSDGTGLRQLTDNSIYVRNPCISGDGSKIAFVGGERDSEREIYIINYDGSGLLQLTDNSVEDGLPSINYDGSKIAYQSDVGGDYEIFMLSTTAATSEVYELASYSFMSVEAVGPTMVFGSARAPSGTVQIPVTLNNADNVGSMDLVLTYDSSVLRATEVRKGSLTEDSIVQSNIVDGTVRIGFIDMAGVSGSGSFVNVIFEIIDTDTSSATISKDGRTAISVDPGFERMAITSTTTKAATGSELVIESVSAKTVDGDPVSITTIDGMFDIGSVMGDCNRDGMITSVDALMALQMSIGTIPEDLVADIDGDGSVAAFDSLEIMKSSVRMSGSFRMESGVLK
ncbi:cohesin domain-containing protein [Methanococcoides methylutens]|uniref:Translocation protein TolB n=1 Tax=Methanococcoides methylutens MM1 TaxID=1434104 RepID=A0A0E3X079_METMT|nr:cohesin domain-containing protein [Methanococcoides methylutens]AKB85589.1 translocation protein TolB [Methanococcoides methylutens MM1]